MSPPISPVPFSLVSPRLLSRQVMAGPPSPHFMIWPPKQQAIGNYGILAAIGYGPQDTIRIPRSWNFMVAFGSQQLPPCWCCAVSSLQSKPSLKSQGNSRRSVSSMTQCLFIRAIKQYRLYCCNRQTNLHPSFQARLLYLFELMASCPCFSFPDPKVPLCCCQIQWQNDGQHFG